MTQNGKERKFLPLTPKSYVPVTVPEAPHRNPSLITRLFLLDSQHSSTPYRACVHPALGQEHLTEDYLDYIYTHIMPHNDIAQV